MVEEFDGEKRDENYEDVMFYKKMYGTCYPYLTMTSRMRRGGGGEGVGGQPQGGAGESKQQS